MPLPTPMPTHTSIPNSGFAALHAPPGAPTASGSSSAFTSPLISHAPIPPAPSLVVLPHGPPDTGSSGNAASTPTPAPSSAQAPAPAPPYTGSHISIPYDAIPSGQLNPRSCVTCRRRKVRCDKQMPCSNCRKARTHCVFPAPGRAPRRPRPKDPNAPPKHGSSEREAELMRRLRKLEGIVEDLSGQVEMEKHSTAGSAGNSPDPTAHVPSPPSARSNLGQAIYGGMDGMATPTTARRAMQVPASSASDTTENRNLRRQGSDPVQSDFGRLVLSEKGKTRYVSSAFWSKINDELDKLREETHCISDEDSDESENEATPQSMGADPGSVPGDNSSHQGFLFGYSTSDVNLRSLHPLVSQIPFLWQVFQENVDPLVKILHTPTMNKIIRDLRANMDSLTPATEALMFSIYYAALTSMDDNEVNATFHTNKSALVNQYRFALEQALSRANFLTSPDVTILQAFVLFLVLVRRHDDTRFSWTLTGLAIRIAQSLGLHRDGVHFPNLTPFEVEMRRRLWWAVCVLDLRSAEDQGTELTILDKFFDTELPLNINDDDISPESRSFPRARDAHTDVTFALIRYEICVMARRMHTVTSVIGGALSRDADLTMEMREKMLVETHERINNKYLKYGSTTDNPMYWVAAIVARLILAKLSLVVHQAVLFPPSGTEVSQHIRDRLFVSSMQTVEYNLILNTEPRCKQWHWLFQTYTQWHAVAYLLVDMCRRPWTPIVERAWTSVSASFSRGPDLARISGNTAVWQPLRKLFLKARRHRDTEAVRLRTDPDAAAQLRASDNIAVPPARFGALPTSIDGSMALARWSELVSPGQTPAPETPATTVQPAAESELKGKGPEEESPPFDDKRMKIVDNVLNWGIFNPMEMMPAAYPNDDDVAVSQSRDAVMRGGSHAPRCHTGGGKGEHSGTQGQGVGAPVSHAGNNLPPWLWPDPWGAIAGTAPVEGGLAVGGGGGDVNMDLDDDFDWDVFQENMKGFTVRSVLGHTL